MYSLLKYSLVLKYLTLGTKISNKRTGDRAGRSDAAVPRRYLLYWYKKCFKKCFLTATTVQILTKLRPVDGTLSRAISKVLDFLALLVQKYRC